MVNLRQASVKNYSFPHALVKYIIESSVIEDNGKTAKSVYVSPGKKYPGIDCTHDKITYNAGLKGFAKNRGKSGIKLLYLRSEPTALRMRKKINICYHYKTD